MIWALARALLLACAFSLAPASWAQLAIPALSGHVIDQTGSLTSEVKDQLERELTAFEARKGSQLAVLIVPTTAPEAIEQYTLRVAEKWKLGRKKTDDGAILVVAKNDRSLRIEVGYGLEGALSDAVSKRIIDETIVPRFKQQDFVGGIQAGAQQMMSVVDGETLPAPAWPGRTSGAAGAGDNLGDALSPAAIAAALGLVVVSLLARALMGAVLGSFVTAGLAAGAAWLVTGVMMTALMAAGAAFFVTLVGVFNLLRVFMSGGSYSTGGGYIGGGGGRSGGGFSGGGGGFGGGGASGRW